MTHHSHLWVLSVATDWVMMVISLAFILLRLYTQYFIRHELWYDDYTIVGAWIFYGIGNALYTASYEGFLHGHTVLHITTDPAMYIHSEKLNSIAIFFFFVGFSLAKPGIGLFLYRLAIIRWQKILLLVVSIVFLIWTLITAITAMLTSGPLMPGNNSLDTVRYMPLMMPLFVSIIVVDFSIAIFPWYIFRNTKMKLSKKITICVSLGLAGFLGGGASIGRVATIWQGIQAGYTPDTSLQVNMWRTWEMGLTLVFASVPTLLPLYYRWRTWWSKRGPAENGFSDPEAIGAQDVDTPPSDDLAWAEKGQKKPKGPGPDTLLIQETGKTQGTITTSEGTHTTQGTGTTVT